MARREEFLHPRFILCEGPEDAAFLRALIAARGMPPFDVSPTVDCGGAPGNSGFSGAMLACEPMTNFPKVSTIVLMADNDDDPAAAFAALCKQIEKVRNCGLSQRKWGLPKAPAVTELGDPSVAIWMSPAAGAKGCLETLIWQVLATRHPKAAKCAMDACKCSGAQNWPPGKMAKAQVRCFIAIACRKNPAMGLGNIWTEASALIPLNDPTFDPVETFLRGV